jgi:site-specific DNA recombinase
MPRCAIYARVSTDKQGDSVEHQVSLMKEWAKRKSIDGEQWSTPDKNIYIDDAISASKIGILDRPAIKRMMEDAKNKKFDAILFKGISRFVRDVQDALMMLNQFEALDVRTISYEESYDSKTSSVFMFTIHSAVAQEEAQKIGIRVSLGNKQKAAKGQWANSRPPIGYVVNKETKKLEFGSPDQIRTVRFIFDSYVNDGMGTFKIAEELNSRGWLTTNNRSWSRTTVAQVLKNQVYIGNVVYGKKRYKSVQRLDGYGKRLKTINIDQDEWSICEDAHPEITDKATFNKAQNILKSRNVGQTFKNVIHPLTGLLKCGKCGEGMVCQKRSYKDKEYRYYICKTYHKFGRNVCSQSNVNANELEAFIIEKLKEKINEYYSKSDKMNILVYAQKTKGDIISKLKKIESSIDELNQATVQLLKRSTALTDEQFNYANEDFKKQLQKLNDEKYLTEEELRKIDKTDTRKILEEEMKMFLSEGNIPVEELRRYSHLLIHEIVIEGSDVDIHATFE